MIRTLLLAFLAALALAGCTAPKDESGAPLRKPDVEYVPTEREVVPLMLGLAGVTADDLVYDLGSGDGRIPIAAARMHGARAVGIDIDPALVAKARDNAREAGVEHLVTFRNEDLFRADFSDATVVTLFLWPEINLRLRPRLLAELRPGTRIVSHWHDMGDWKPERVVAVSAYPLGERNLYLWVVPER